MVNCALYQTTSESSIVVIDKLNTVAGLFLHRLDKNYISEVIFEVCEGSYAIYIFIEISLVLQDSRTSHINYFSKFLSFLLHTCGAVL